MSEPANAENTVAFQGHPGANSHLACREAYPDLDALADLCDVLLNLNEFVYIQ